ncbi:unnamed protein product [Closterium sp. Naga37s-1]|nr:unnamed protein product [Closterium sp. Naga37s-1]
MPAALGDEFSYPPPPFDGAFAARAWSASSASVVTSAEMSSVPAPPSSAPAALAVRPAAPAADSPAGAKHPVLAQELACSVPVPLAPGPAPDLPLPVAASVDPAVPAAPSAAPIPAEPILPGGSSPLAASAATGGSAPVAGSGETVHSALRPVTMADLQRVVSLEMRRERAGQVGPPSLPQGAPLAAAPPPVAPPAAASSAAASPRSASRRSAPPAAGALQPFQALVGPLPVAEVPEAMLGQLWRLSERLRAVHLIQMYGHAGLSRGNSLDDGSRDECLDAADRLAELLAPVLAAPARGGAAGVGQLGTAVRGLRRFSRAGSAADVIVAGTAVVRELHRSVTGLLAVLDADQL